MLVREVAAGHSGLHPYWSLLFLISNRWDYSPRVFAMISSATAFGTSA